jgi:hypothetical protein
MSFKLDGEMKDMDVVYCLIALFVLAGIFCVFVFSRKRCGCGRLCNCARCGCQLRENMKANFKMPLNLADPISRVVQTIEYSDFETTPEIVLNAPFQGSSIRFMSVVMTTINQSDLVNKQIQGYQVNWIVANIPVTSRKVSDGEQWLNYMPPKEAGHIQSQLVVFGHTDKMVNPGQVARQQSANQSSDPYRSAFLKNQEIGLKPSSIVFVKLKEVEKAPVNQQTTIRDPAKREMPVVQESVQPDQVIEKNCQAEFQKCFQDTNDLNPTDRVAAMRECQQKLQSCRNPEVTRNLRCRKMYTDCAGKVASTGDFAGRMSGLKECKQSMQACLRPDAAPPGTVNVQSSMMDQKNVCLNNYISCLQKLKTLDIADRAQYIKDCQDQYRMCMERSSAKREQTAPLS